MAAAPEPFLRGGATPSLLVLTSCVVSSPWRLALPTFSLGLTWRGSLRLLCCTALVAGPPASAPTRPSVLLSFLPEIPRRPSASLPFSTVIRTGRLVLLPHCVAIVPAGLCIHHDLIYGVGALLGACYMVSFPLSHSALLLYGGGA